MGAATTEAWTQTPPTGGRRPAPSRSLTVRVATSGRRVTLRLAGKLDVYTIPGLRMHMARHDPGEGDVSLDLSHVTLVDSSGLGTLLSFANRARHGGRRLGLVCLPELAEALRIARFADAFDLTVVPDGPPAAA